MTRAQEQAASAARKACIAWMKSPSDVSTSEGAMYIAWRAYRSETPGAESHASIYRAYRAAWRTTWETA